MRKAVAVAAIALLVVLVAWPMLLPLLLLTEPDALMDESIMCGMSDQSLKRVQRQLMRLLDAWSSAAQRHDYTWWLDGDTLYACMTVHGINRWSVPHGQVSMLVTGALPTLHAQLEPELRRENIEFVEIHSESEGESLYRMRLLNESESISLDVHLFRAQANGMARRERARVEARESNMMSALSDHVAAYFTDFSLKHVRPLSRCTLHHRTYPAPSMSADLLRQRFPLRSRVPTLRPLYCSLRQHAWSISAAASVALLLAVGALYASNRSRRRAHHAKRW